MTDPAVGSGDLFGVVACETTETKKSEISLGNTTGSGFRDRIVSSIGPGTRTDSPFFTMRQRPISKLTLNRRPCSEPFPTTTDAAWGNLAHRARSMLATHACFRD